MFVTNLLFLFISIPLNKAFDLMLLHILININCRFEKNVFFQYNDICRMVIFCKLQKIKRRMLHFNLKASYITPYVREIPLSQICAFLTNKLKSKEVVVVFYVFEIKTRCLESRFLNSKI